MGIVIARKNFEKSCKITSNHDTILLGVYIKKVKKLRKGKMRTESIHRCLFAT